MRKRRATFLTAVAVLLGALLAAGAAAGRQEVTPTPDAERIASGVVTQLDVEHKVFVLTEEGGAKTSIHWNGATHFAGEMFQGALVKVRFVQRGEMLLAISVIVRPQRGY